MVRTILVAAILAGMPALSHADSAAAPLIVTATVVSTCQVDVPQSAGGSTLASSPVVVTCAKRGAMPRVQRPIAPRRHDIRDAVLIVNF